MQRKFLTSLLLIVLLNLLVKPFYILGIDAEVQNRVGEEVYGNYFSLLNFSFLLNIFLDLGITNYNTRNVAQHPFLLKKHFFRIMSLRFLLFFLYLSFSIFTGMAIGYSNYEMSLLMVLLINQFLVAVIQFSRSNFGGLHLFKTDAFISILDRALLIIFCSLLLWGNILGDQFEIEWFVYAQTLAYGLSAIISLILLGKVVGKFRIRLKRAFTLAILKQSFPYALLIFLMMMYNRVDAVMIERLLPDGNLQAGIYAQGFRILDAVNMFALLFAGILLPIFARMIKQKDSVQDMMELALRILMVFSLVIAIFGFVYQDELMKLRYSGAVKSSSVTFGYLILTFIPVSITYVFGTLLTANGSLKQLNLMAFFGVMLNVILNYILIRQYSAEGAAIATLVTQIFTALIQVILVYAIFRFRINLWLYARFALFAILLIILTYMGLWVSDKTDTTIHIPLYFLLSPFLALLLGLIKYSDLKVIFGRSLRKEDQSQ